MTVVEIFEYISKGGLWAGGAWFIYALSQGKLIWGRDYDSMKSSLEKQLNESQTTNRGFIDKALAKLDRLEQQGQGKGPE